MEKKITKVEIRRQAIARWWSRGPWPCVLLAIDPGTSAGASLARSTPTGISLIWSEQVDTYERDTVEDIVTRAVDYAEDSGLPLVAMLEDWGAGGPRGLSQWIGLGETRGVWKRHLLIAASESKALTKSRIVKVTQSRWRSRVIDATGVPGGKVHPKTGDLVWRKFNTDEWKVQARQTASDYFLDTFIPMQEDAAESACMLIYGSRSDEVLKVLGSSHLKKHGMNPETFEPLEKLIKGSKRK